MWRLVLVTALLHLTLSAAAQAAPQRVVSMNLCTDQLAMLLAAPGQLVSVSQLSRDPHYSSMSDEAQALLPNSGQAEEIAFLRPDLVLAGSYTTRMTVDMLKRLGHWVEVFEPENNLDDIVKNLRRMGQVLGREAAAEALIQAMTEQLAQHRQNLPPDRPDSLLYSLSGFTSGAGTLADEIIREAGLHNMATDLGFGGGGVISLEALVLAGPERIVQSQSYSAPSQDQERLGHPVLKRLFDPSKPRLETAPEWTCGTPFTLAAIAKLAREARH